MKDQQKEVLNQALTEYKLNNADLKKITNDKLSEEEIQKLRVLFYKEERVRNVLRGIDFEANNIRYAQNNELIENKTTSLNINHNGLIVSVTVDSITTENSHIYNLCINDKGQENINAEIEKIKQDIKTVKTFLLLDGHLVDVASILKCYTIRDEAIERISLKYTISTTLINQFLALDLNNLHKMDFGGTIILLKQNLELLLKMNLK
jgi:hypothetical protein